MKNNNGKTKEEMKTTGNEKAEWCYTCLWMMRYDYECENGCYYINNPRHSIEATVAQLKLRWPEEKVPCKEWFEGVIYNKALWSQIDMEEQEYHTQCNEKYATDEAYRAQQDAVTAILRS